MAQSEINSNLTDQQKDILFKKATETPFTGKYLNHKGNGMYTCANCGAEIFSSDTKFESGTGWPSFNNPKNAQAVHLKEDLTGGMHRIEVTCANCGGHLGHVFNDAPDQPTGMRFCINSCALDFLPKTKSEKEKQE